MVIQNFAEEETINFPEIIKKFNSKFFLERPMTSEFTSTPLIFLHHIISFYAERHRIAPHSIAAVSPMAFSDNVSVFIIRFFRFLSCFLSGVLSSLRMPFFCRYPSFDFPVAVDISCDYTCICSLGSRILSLDFSPMRILKSTVSSLSLVFNNFVCLLLIFISYSLHETVFSLFIISSTETSLASRHHRLVV